MAEHLNALYAKSKWNSLTEENLKRLLLVLALRRSECQRLQEGAPKEMDESSTTTPDGLVEKCQLFLNRTTNKQQAQHNNSDSRNYQVTTTNPDFEIAEVD